VKVPVAEVVLGFLKLPQTIENGVPSDVYSVLNKDERVKDICGD
jgi:hypothetical protein